MPAAAVGRLARRVRLATAVSVTCPKVVVMSSPSAAPPTPEGPGSVSGAPNLASGFTDTFASRYVDAVGCECTR